MGKHLKYINYIVRHKYFVLRAGLKTKASLWRLLIHDWTKMLPGEWGPYANFFYTTGGTGAAFDRAWLRHIHRNDHHWEHWVLRSETGVVKCLEMPEPVVREMVADWMGAGRAIHGEWRAYKWYVENPRIELHPATRARVEHLLGDMNRIGMA